MPSFSWLVSKSLALSLISPYVPLPLSLSHSSYLILQHLVLPCRTTIISCLVPCKSFLTVLPVSLLSPCSLFSKQQAEGPCYYTNQITLSLWLKKNPQSLPNSGLRVKVKFLHSHTWYSPVNSMTSFPKFFNFPINHCFFASKLLFTFLPWVFALTVPSS